MNPATRWIRRALFVVLAAWMLGGPAYRQVFDGDNQHVREWRMFGTRAARTCRVIFEVQTDAGWTPVSRWELEGFGRSPWPGVATRMLDTPQAAERAGRRLCARVDGPLRFRQRCGHARRGWGAWTTSAPLCVGGP